MKFCIICSLVNIALVFINLFFYIHNPMLISAGAMAINGIGALFCALMAYKIWRLGS